MESELLEYIKQYVPEGEGYLAGNSVHVDQEFMKIEFPRVINWLHYRIIGTSAPPFLGMWVDMGDVSSIKILSTIWDPELKNGSPQKKYEHRALEDIKESIMELQYYKDNLWKIKDN